MGDIGYIDDTTTSKLFGTLEIEGMGIYYVFASQSKSRVVWMLTERDIIQDELNKDNSKMIAIVRSYSTGKIEGMGKTYLLTRLLDNINVMVGRAAQHRLVKSSFFTTGEYYSEDNEGSMIKFKTALTGRNYQELEMVHEGFKLSMSAYTKKLPFAVPAKLTPIVDERTNAAIVAGLGVKTFSLIKRRYGSRLDWYENKDYKLINSNESFRAMMLEYLRDVQKAHEEEQAILTGCDTETTGLNMLKLKPSNKLRDHIVAIPFGWENDKAYLICTDMYYFGNVDEGEVFPLFDKLFSRNDDYTYQDIEFDYCGEHFKFNRKNILLVGANVDFDIRAFLCHDARVFFDEDIQKMHYNLATDWSQGKNSLKYMTHRYLGDETLELEELFGPQHKDKFRYLSDPELALLYGGADADYPRLLWKKLRGLYPNNLYNLYRKYDMTLVYRTAIATWEGMEVDTRAVKEQGAKVQQDLKTLQDFIYSYAYAANRNNISDKASKLSELLGLDDTKDIEDVGRKEGMYRYPFTPANHKNLLFRVLGYPVIKVSEKSQEPALDKFVLQKLADRNRETPVEFLKEDIPSASDPSTPLISKDVFNSKMYPLAIVFQTYASLNKEYTSYYKPIMVNDMEDRMFYSFSLQRAATRRILSPGQTMKGTLKKLVIAPPGRLFMCFDASQIEYRHMASLAYIQTKELMKREDPDNWEKKLCESGIYRIFNMMQKPEADYHIETASFMTGQPQYMIDKATRSIWKSVGFGIPYGLGDHAMCENLFGKVTPEKMQDTKNILSDYKKRQLEIMRLLESVRDSAFIPANIPEEFREMLDIGDTHVGIVRNFVGFYRLFILENLTRARTGRIRRQAGNCAIQGGAAELFRRMLYNFYIGSVRANIHNDISWKMLVHDEVDTTVDSNIDVCKLIKIIQENCTLRYPDHIPYYVGIGFGPNWYEAKGDNAELPVIMVDRLIDAYDRGKFSIPSDGQQATNLLKLKKHYMCDRVAEELQRLIPEVGPGYKWDDKAIDYVDENFTNYVVRSYLPSFLTKEHSAQFKKNPPLKILLEDWQSSREKYGFDVTFLSEKFEDARVEIKNLMLEEPLSLDITDDYHIDLDLLSEDDEDETLLEAMGESSNSWFGEGDLFDYSIPQDEILTDTEEGYRYYNDLDKESDGFELNPNPTNAFDVYISKHYQRKYIYTSAEGKYSIMLSGTKYHNNVSLLAQAIRQQFGSGSDSITLIGSDIKKIVNIGCSPEKLDALDKVICMK